MLRLYELVEKRGIMAEFTLAYLSKSNGNTQLLNRTLFDIFCNEFLNTWITRKDMWSEAVNTAWFLRYFSVPKSCKQRYISHGVLHCRLLRHYFVRIFGIRASVYNQDKKRLRTFDTRAVERIMAGLARGSAYRVWPLDKILSPSCKTSNCAAEMKIFATNNR